MGLPRATDSLGIPTEQLKHARRCRDLKDIASLSGANLIALPIEEYIGQSAACSVSCIFEVGATHDGLRIACARTSDWHGVSPSGLPCGLRVGRAHRARS